MFSDGLRKILFTPVKESFSPQRGDAPQVENCWTRKSGLMAVKSWSIIDGRGVRPRTGFLTECSWGGDNEILSVGLDRALVAASSRRQKAFGTPFGHRDTLKASAHSDSLTSHQQKISHTAKLQISQ